MTTASMHVSAEWAETLAELLDADLRPAYSGRGMNGATCLGLVARSPMGLMLKLGRLVETGEGDANFDLVLGAASDLFEYVRTDNMGWDTIVYWPRIQVTE